MKELKSHCLSAGIAHKFKFLGGQLWIPEVLSVMDVYLQPSRTEGFSNAILEAMAAGLPVVATRVGGNAEVIDDGINGFLVESEDLAGITSSLLRLIAEPELRGKMGSVNKRKVLNHFDVSCMIDNYERYYNECICKLCSSKAP
jgi:glycosyltransferase involved in cell wall biosynthesis